MRAVRTWLLQAPLASSVAAVTIVVIGVSVAVSYSINALKGETYPVTDWLFPSALSPALITPVVAYLFLSIARRLERLRTQLAGSVERERLLAQEMRHRIKNLFSVTAGLITLAEREVPEDSRHQVPDILRTKLAALARASDATFTPEISPDGPAGSFDFGKIVQSVMAPYEGRVRASGAETAVNEQAMTSVALLLHELATNAVKYGALGSPAGMADISWTRGDGSVTLRWQESGGPEIASSPGREGFGSAVIDRIVRILGGSVTKHWLPTGLVVDIVLPDDQ